MSIYQPSFMSPNNNAVNFASATTFASQVNGSLITHVKDVIYRVDTGAVLYDSTQVAVTPNLYDKDTLSRTVSGGVITYKGSVKWVRTCWNGTASATSKEVQFYSASTPTASINTIGAVATKSKLFTTTYSQAELIAVERYQYFLYSSSDVLVEQSEVFYSQRLTHTFAGFLDTTTYKVRCLVTNVYGQVADTGLVSFSVDYVQPNVFVSPSLTVDEALSAIRVGLSEVVQIAGTSSGTVSYVDLYLATQNVGLQLTDGASYVNFNVAIPNVFTQTVIFEPDGFVSGKIISYDNGVYDIGYDGIKFYFSYYDNTDQMFAYGIPLTLNSNPYVIAVKPDRVIICQNNVILDTVKVY